MHDPDDHSNRDTAVSVDDPETLGRLSHDFAEWEPRLVIHRPPVDSLIYEPDGTFYAINLAAGASFKSPRGVRDVGLGDALVIPREVSVDAGPEVDLIGVLYNGPPPDHFRERFIQVSGYEHFPAARPDAAGPALVEVIPASPPRRRVSYATADLSPDTTLVSAGRHAMLLIALSGEFLVRLEDQDRGRHSVLPVRTLRVLWPGMNASVTGSGRLGCVCLLDESTYGMTRLGGFSDGLRHEAAPRPGAEAAPPPTNYLQHAGLRLISSTSG